MSNAYARLAAFAVLLVAVFTGAALLGSATEPTGSSADEGHSAEMTVEHGARTTGDAGKAPAAAHGGGEHGDAPAAAGASAALPGLQIAQDGYRLAVDRDRYEPRDRTTVRFRVLGADGEAVTRFELEHEKRLHFIVVRRDLSGFQHLHPTMAADGTWSADVDLSKPGTWRLFADFKRDGTQRTLGADVQVPGPFRPAATLASGTSARSDGGLDVTLRSTAPRTGADNQLDFEVRDGDRVVNDRLEPYLGARGHLVALREGDLAYLHTHPDGDRLSFATSWPSAGAYRLFVQFQYEGRIHTATFAQEVSR